MNEHTSSRAPTEPAAASRRFVLQAIADAGSATAVLGSIYRVEDAGRGEGKTEKGVRLKIPP